jgi:transcriptional regulator with XRE-family HTH domain
MSGIEADARTREALHAAQLYYERDRTMEQIAAELNVSRSSVSRLLSYARDRARRDHGALAPAGQHRVARVAERYGISVHVVSSPPRTPDAEKLERTARAAARASPQRSTPMHPSASPGARRCRRSRGTCRRSASQLADRADERRRQRDHIGHRLFGRDPRALRQSFGADVQQFPVPALFDDPRRSS